MVLDGNTDVMKWVSALEDQFEPMPKQDENIENDDLPHTNTAKQDGSISLSNEFASCPHPLK